jgi:hypothetical protein
MRTVFTIELKADIAGIDDDRRKAFIDLSVMTAKQLYAQAGMIAEKPPQITVSEVGGNGKVNHPLFEDATPQE